MTQTYLLQNLCALALLAGSVRSYCSHSLSSLSFSLSLFFPPSLPICCAWQGLLGAGASVGVAKETLNSLIMAHSLDSTSDPSSPPRPPPPPVAPASPPFSAAIQENGRNDADNDGVGGGDDGEGDDVGNDDDDDDKKNTDAS